MGLLLKFFLGWIYVLIPHGIALFFYFIAAVVVLFLSWWAILFTREVSQGILQLHSGDAPVGTQGEYLPLVPAR